MPGTKKRLNAVVLAAVLPVRSFAFSAIHFRNRKFPGARRVAATRITILPGLFGFDVSHSPGLFMSRRMLPRKGRKGTTLVVPKRRFEAGGFSR
jgi:hypothetical protein